MQTETASGVQAVLFDVFGTLVDWRSGIAREAGRWLAPLGITLDWSVFADRWRSRYQPSMEAVRSDRRPWTTLDRLHRETLVETLAEHGINDLPDTVLHGLTLGWHRLDPWPDVVAGLTRLKARHMIAPHSNGNVRLLVDMAKRAGLPWDLILGAEVVRAYKPLPDSYRRAVSLLDLEPEQCLLAAAHNDDLRAARACGLRTAFIPRPTEHGPGQTTDLQPETRYTLVAADLVDLASQLDC